MMKTVSTLCATGSIIGAAGVGWGFGQAPNQHITRTYEGLNRVTPPSSTGYETPSQLQVLPTPYSHLDAESTSSARNTTPQSSLESRTLYTSPRAAGKSRIVFKNLGATSQTSEVYQPEKESPNFVQRRPSRLHRLASFTFSVKSSPTVSSGPYPRSLAQSSGSAAPIIPLEQHSSPLPPNKLVKRSLSQHLIQRPGTSDDDKKWQTLDRPATSHKRLATLSRRPLAEDENSTFVSRSSQYPRSYQPFFRPKVPKDKASAAFRNKSGLGDFSNIRRIYPVSLDRPVLIPSYSVLPSSVEVDGSLTIESEPFVFGSRPSTPSGIIQFFSSPGPPPTSKAQGIVPDPEPRRSFSIGELLSRNPSIGRGPRKIPIWKGRRVTSAPAFSMHDGRSPRTAEQSHKRRDVGASKARRASGSQQDPKIVPEHQVSASSYVAADVQHYKQMEKTVAVSGTHPQTPLSKGDSPASNVSVSSMSRPWPHSTTPSDNTSSQIGSDVDGQVFSSGDEDEGDKQSDSVYDSLRTGATRSSSGFRGPALETLFDKEPARESASNTPSAKAIELRDPVQSNSRINLEDDGSSSTPAKTVIADSRESRRSSDNNAPRTPTIASSVPTKPEHLTLEELRWDSDLGDDEYSLSEEDLEEDWDDVYTREDYRQNESSSHAAGRSVPVLDPSGRPLKYFGPQKSGAEQEQKNNLFDWSEQQPLQIGSEDRPPPRPKTVHGKKNPGGRGSRSAGRRAPSGLHARSQSVPVLADLAASRTPITSKFGTWGIGSKGVTEDWNEDFELDASEVPSAPDESSRGSVYIRNTMVVPDAIKARQTNVLANIGLLKEWGILIEELKELRERTVSLNLEADQLFTSDIFDEVDAMIDLADQEADDDGLPTYQTPNKAPSGDFEGIELTTSSPATLNALRFDVSSHDDDIFGPAQTRAVPKSSPSARTPEKDANVPISRPRKNSEAVAHSVIRALQARAKAQRPSASPRTPARKVPFDTTTLRHIVPYVNGLSKKMKQIIREAEGLQSSPKQGHSTAEPRLRQAFIEPDQDDA